MSSHIFTDHPLPWSQDGVFVRDGRARIIGAMHTLAQTQRVVEAVNCTAVTPAPLPVAAVAPPVYDVTAPVWDEAKHAPPALGAVLSVLAEQPPPTLHEALAVVEANRLRSVPEVSTLVLEAMKDVPSRTLEREQQRDDWRGRVAGAELTRRLDEITRIRNQG